MKLYPLLIKINSKYASTLSVVDEENHRLSPLRLSAFLIFLAQF
jgi:hypothetical protein